MQPCDEQGVNLCLGSLEPGTYTSRLFNPPLTYHVEDGWANGEDEDGNFLLLPPGEILSGVNAGTSNFLGMYSTVRAPYECTEEADPAVAATPEEIADWLRNQDELVTSEPENASVGGLSGLVLDISASPSGRSCSFGFFMVFVGEGRASVTHTVSSQTWMRLYLLASGDGTLAIELAGPSDDRFTGWIAGAEEVVGHLEFPGIDPVTTVTETASSCDLDAPGEVGVSEGFAVSLVNATGTDAEFGLLLARPPFTFEDLVATIDVQRAAAEAGNEQPEIPDELAWAITFTGEMPPNATSTMLGANTGDLGVVCLRYFEEVEEIRPAYVSRPF